MLSWTHLAVLEDIVQLDVRQPDAVAAAHGIQAAAVAGPATLLAGCLHGCGGGGHHTWPGTVVRPRQDQPPDCLMNQIWVGAPHAGTQNLNIDENPANVSLD